MKAKTSNSRREITVVVSEDCVEIEIKYHAREYEKESYFFEREEFDDIMRQFIEGELLEEYL